MLSRLGPSFIKAGQVLANRPDVLRADYMTELCILQDNVPAFPNQEAFAIIEVKAPSFAAVVCFPHHSPCHRRGHINKHSKRAGRAPAAPPMLLLQGIQLTEKPAQL